MQQDNTHNVLTSYDGLQYSGEILASKTYSQNNMVSKKSMHIHNTIYDTLRLVCTIQSNPTHSGVISRCFQCEYNNTEE